MPIFVKILNADSNNYLIVNLNQIIYVAVNDRRGSCKIFLEEKLTITCLPKQGYALLSLLDRYVVDLDDIHTPLLEEGGI